MTKDLTQIVTAEDTALFRQFIIERMRPYSDNPEKDYERIQFEKFESDPDSYLDGTLCEYQREYRYLKQKLLPAACDVSVEEVGFEMQLKNKYGCREMFDILYDNIRFLLNFRMIQRIRKKFETWIPETREAIERRLFNKSAIDYDRLLLRKIEVNYKDRLTEDQTTKLSECIRLTDEISGLYQLSISQGRNIFGARQRQYELLFDPKNTAL